MKCTKGTRACRSSTHDVYFHRRTQVLFWPWQSGRSSSCSWWWTTATAAEISAGISQPPKTYVKLNKSETTETCLLNLCIRQEKTTRAVNSAETSESERGDVQWNTSHRTDVFAQVQIPVAQYQTRLKYNNHNTKKGWTVDLKYTNNSSNRFQTNRDRRHERLWKLLTSN